MRLSMIRAYILAGTVLFGSSVASLQAQEVFGTWRGLYTPTERFIGNNIPVGTPPFDPIELQLILHPLDTTTGRYGVSSFGAGEPGEFVYGGDVVTLSQNGANLMMTTFSPAEGEPTGYSDLMAVVSGNTMTGMYNARSPAGPGWTHLRGTI